MGQTIWVDVEGRGDGDELPADLSIMLRLEEPLDRLAADLGVPALSTFYDDSAIADEFADLLEESDDIDDAPSSAGKWFDPRAALPTVRALRGRLAEDPDALKLTAATFRTAWPEQLRDELAIAEAELERAVAAGRRFRLLLVS